MEKYYISSEAKFKVLNLRSRCKRGISQPLPARQVQLSILNALLRNFSNQSFTNKKILNLRASRIVNGTEPNNKNRPKGRGINLDPAKKAGLVQLTILSSL